MATKTKYTVRQRQIIQLTRECYSETYAGWYNTLLDTEEGSEDWIEAKAIVDETTEEKTKYLYDYIMDESVRRGWENIKFEGTKNIMNLITKVVIKLDR